MRRLLLKILGPLAPLVHSDTGTLDRWLWVKRRLPLTNNKERLLDVGCGTGAFTINADKRGYHCLALTWDEKDTKIAESRAADCNAVKSKFRVVDVRKLDLEGDLFGQFDVVLCCENIEHIIDDRKLMKDLYNTLKPGGRLLLTTPWYKYNPITLQDAGPFLSEETGWHVRRGYTRCMLEELAIQAGFQIEEIDYNVGWLSQKTIFIFQKLKFMLPVAWIAVLPLRFIVHTIDRPFTRFFNLKFFSICMEAYKPRFEATR